MLSQPIAEPGGCASHAINGRKLKIGGAGGMVQVLYLDSKHKTLSSKPSTAKK
jgi:hypothetical protein